MNGVRLVLCVFCLFCSNVRFCKIGLFWRVRACFLAVFFVLAVGSGGVGGIQKNEKKGHYPRFHYS